MRFPVKDVATQLSLVRISDKLFQLTVVDHTSGVPILDLELDVERFADLLSARMTTATVPGKLTVAVVHGRRKELRRVTRDIPETADSSVIERIREAGRLLQIENPEWIVLVPQASTHSRVHMVDGKPTYTFEIVRWVDKEGAADGT